MQKIPITFKVGLEEEVVVNRPEVVMSQDRGSAFLQITIDKPMDSVSVYYHAKLVDVRVEATTEDEDRLIWLAPIDGEWVTEKDKVSAYVYGQEDGKQYDIGQMSFNVGVSAIDKQIEKVKVTYFDQLEQIRDSMTAWIDDYKVIANEELQIQKDEFKSNEEIRQSQEAIRKESELDRETLMRSWEENISERLREVNIAYDEMYDLIESHTNNTPTIVIHGDDETVARPDKTVVYWIGDAEPIHAQKMDLWSGNTQLIVVSQ